METKNSSINRAMGRQLKREQSVSMSVRELAERTGISDATINRMWSKNPRDINITQITWLAALMGVTPQQLVERAVQEAGGLATIMQELDLAVSGGRSNVINLKRPTTAAEVDEYEGDVAASPLNDEAVTPDE